MTINSKEYNAVEVMKADDSIYLLHDDKLVLRALKTGIGNRSGIGLDIDYWKELEYKLKNGKPELTGYWNNKTFEHHGIDWLESEKGWIAFNNEKGWKEVIKKVYTKGFPEGVELIFNNNQIDLRIRNLYDNLGSRYTATMNYLVPLASKIIKYNPRVENPTQRNITEALRHRIKKAFLPSEYEYNILIKGELGLLIMNELKEWSNTGKGHKEENTVYLKGWNKDQKNKGQTIVKFYDIGARDFYKGGIAGTIFKLEITLRKAYFKKEGLLINDLITQPKIQEILKKELVKQLNTSLNCLKKGGKAMNMIRQKLDLTDETTNYTTAIKVINTKKTLTERMAIVEKQIKEMNQRIKKLESKNI